MMPMIPKILIAVAAGGALGALARYGLTSWIYRWAPDSFPWGTFAVNMVGSLFLGIVLGLFDGAVPETPWRAFLTIGLAGAFTTFSTFSYENVLLLQDREYARAVLYMGGSVAGAVSALLLGLVVAGLLVQRS
jgi:CrcB protein